MRTTMFSHLIVIAAMAAILTTAGCDGSVDKASFQAVQKQSAESAKQLKDVNTSVVLLGSQLKVMQKKLDDMQKNFDQVSADVAAMATRGGGSPEANKALDQRLGAIEARLQKANEDMAALQQRGGEVKARPARPGETSEASSAPAPAKTAKPAAARTQTATTWHLLKQGETIESVAKQYGVSAAAIRAKNNIPSGRTVPAGNRIMIPKP